MSIEQINSMLPPAQQAEFLQIIAMAKADGEQKGKADLMNTIAATKADNDARTRAAEETRIREETTKKMVAAARAEGERVAREEARSMDLVNRAAKADSERIVREETARTNAARTNIDRQRMADAPASASGPSRGRTIATFIVNRLKEPKTYLAFMSLAVLFGWSQEQYQVYAGIAATIFASIAILFPETGATDEKRIEPV